MLTRKLRASLAEWRQRFSSLTRDEASGVEAAVWQELEGSIAGRILLFVRQPFVRAAEDSVALGAWRRLGTQWSAASPLHRMRTIGAAVVIAVIVHGAMMLSRPPVGFWWLVLPGIALAFGLCAFVLSFAGRPDQETRV